MFFVNSFVMNNARTFLTQYSRTLLAMNDSIFGFASLAEGSFEVLKNAEENSVLHHLRYLRLLRAYRTWTHDV
jgi:hypothetical protein